LPNILYTGLMEKIIQRETEGFRRLRRTIAVGIFVSVVTCVACAFLFGIWSCWGYFEYNCVHSISFASASDSREVVKLFPENLLNQLRSIAFQIFIIRNLGFHILLGALCGVCWRFLRQKDASIFMILPVIALFFVSTSYLLFGNSFRALSGIWGFNN
jgi:hypothetical protein